jgi:hypothetical protein
MTKLDYYQYTTLAFHRRGALINEVVMLERVIDEYIVNYFCSDEVKSRELKELIICTKRMTFENKMQVSKVLLDRYNKEVLDNNPSLLNDILNTVIPERNIFAHYWLVTTPELSDWLTLGKTVFIKFQNTSEHIEYDEAKFDGIMKLIGKCINVFLDLQKKVFHI